MRITEITTPKYGQVQPARHSHEEKEKLNISQPMMKLAPLPSTVQYLAFAGGHCENLEKTFYHLEALSEKYPDLYPPRMRKAISDTIYAKNPDGETLIDVHRRVYGGLNDCMTLDEAKAMYPEFADVLSIDSVEPRAGSILSDFQEGKLEYFDKDEDLALQLLKLYWGQGYSLKALEPYSGGKQMLHAMNQLNIPLVNRVYGVNLKRSDVEYSKRLVEEMRERRLAKLDRLAQEESGEPVYIKRGKLSAVHKQHISESLKRYFDEHPEAALYLSEVQKEFYNNHPELAITYRRAAQRAWSTESAGNVVRAMITFMENHEHSDFRASVLLDPTKATELESALMKKFWADYPNAKKILSNSMKYAWKQAREDEGVVYEIRLLPKGLEKRFKEWLAEQGASVEENRFYTQYTPSTGEITRPTLFESKAFNDFLSKIPGGKKFMIKVYIETFELLVREMREAHSKKRQYVSALEKRQLFDLNEFGKDMKENLMSKDFAGFYEQQMRTALYEFNKGQARRLERCFDQACTNVAKELMKHIEDQERSDQMDRLTGMLPAILRNSGIFGTKDKK